MKAFGKWEAIGVAVILMAVALFVGCSDSDDGDDDDDGPSGESSSTVDKLIVESVTGDTVYLIAENGTSLAVESDGTVHVAFHTLSTPDYMDAGYYVANLIYGVLEGESWDFTNIEGNETDGETAIALDGSDNPVILYQAVDGGPGALTLAEQKNDGWSKTVIAEGSGDSGCGGWNGLTIDNQGAKHIVWDGNNYAAFSTGQPAKEEFLEYDQVMLDVDIAIDDAGVNHICSYSGQGSGVWYIKGTPGNWEASKVDEDGPTRIGYDCRIAVDDQNNVHIVYGEYGDGIADNIRYATNASGQWEAMELEGEGNVGNFPAIAVDPENRVHVTYRDNDNNRLKYAVIEDGSATIAVLGDLDAPIEDYMLTGQSAIVAQGQTVYVAYDNGGELMLARFPIGWEFE